MAEAAIVDVAREFGIPAVVMVKDATRIIRDGDDVTVDAAAGSHDQPLISDAGADHAVRYLAGLDQRPVELPAFAQAAPVLDDLAAVDAPHLDVVDRDLTTRGWKAEHLADVADPLGRTMHDEISLRYQVIR